LGPGRLRVGIDGLTASGKTSFGHELAEQVVHSGRQALRTSLDDFKKPWRDRHLYDRESGEGYYRNAFDYDAVLIVDGVFAFRPEINCHWDYRIGWRSIPRRPSAAGLSGTRTCPAPTRGPFIATATCPPSAPIPARSTRVRSRGFLSCAVRALWRTGRAGPGSRCNFR
jgi:uridine kinase